ncbi:MAG: type II secretion system major pseudopilin GspG [bacterium]
MFKRLKNVRGMSLVEIMIVIVIMGTVAALVGRNVISQFEKSKVKTTQLQMDSIKTALQDYYLDNGSYPTTEQGLIALVQKPAGSPEPANYSPDGYLKGKVVPKDAWLKDFIYESDGANYSLISLGKDAKEGGEGYGADIIFKSNE